MPLIINDDTTWKSGETVVLDDTVQVADGATLTIEPGALIEGQGHQIQVWGELDIGSFGEEAVMLRDTALIFSSDYDDPGSITLNNVIYDGGAFLPPTGNASYGSFQVSDTQFYNVEGFYIWYPTDASFFQRNVFYQSDNIRILTDTEAL